MFKEDFAVKCSHSQKIKLEIEVKSFPIGQNFWASIQASFMPEILLYLGAQV